MYVGKSEWTFKVRHSNHKREIKNNHGGLGQHFHNSQCNFEEHYRVTLIDNVKMGDKDGLKKKEDFWINQLRTYKTNGGNCMNIRKEL